MGKLAEKICGLRFKLDSPNKFQENTVKPR